MAQVFDSLVIGSGISGLSYALRMAVHGSVAVLAKRGLDDTNTRWAQGGIAAVMDQNDSFDAHVEDTMVAGDGLNHRDVVRFTVEEGPDRLRELMALGVAFTQTEEGPGGLHLTREGGHSARRVVHVKDMTGAAVQAALIKAVHESSNIQVFEDHLAIDLITRNGLGIQGKERCLGAYVLDQTHGRVECFLGRVVMLATGGAGKVYRYTSNPDVATGDGIAMAWRAGARVANMEFFQFHPTCLYHPLAKNFLVSEACRGEGAVLRRLDGSAFMGDYHSLADLAPRDVVARAIDQEMKRSGDFCVHLDMTHLPAHKVVDHFPGIHERLTSFGIDMRVEPVPVVPAAHYCCGGVSVDHFGRSTIAGLLASGETTHTGLHGANRLASNSLLEGLVFAERAARVSLEVMQDADVNLDPQVPAWNASFATDADENILITHAWDETRRLMWNYVGIVRSNLRLARARQRLDTLERETVKDYWSFVVTRDLIELRNIVTVASLIVDCAQTRHESRGLHYTHDYPERDDGHWLRDTVMTRGRRR